MRWTNWKTILNVFYYHADVGQELCEAGGGGDAAVPWDGPHHLPVGRGHLPLPGGLPGDPLLRLLPLLRPAPGRLHDSRPSQVVTEDNVSNCARIEFGELRWHFDEFYFINVYLYLFVHVGAVLTHFLSCFPIFPTKQVMIFDSSLSLISTAIDSA